MNTTKLNVSVNSPSQKRPITLWVEIERSPDALLLSASHENKGTPFFLSADLEEAGITVKPSLPPSEYSEEELKHALRLNDPRVTYGNIYEGEKENIDAWLTGEFDSPEASKKARYDSKQDEKKEERNRQNAFLREKGYKWEKRGYYASGPGEMWEGWFLIDPDGEVIRGEKEIGEEAVPYGIKVETLLTQLGYYGQEALDKLNAEVEHHKARAEAKERVESFFEANESELDVSDERPFSISKTSRTEYKVSEDGIFKLIYNGMDGDNWSYNNDGMYISRRYPYNADIAADLEFLKI